MQLKMRNEKSYGKFGKLFYLVAKSAFLKHKMNDKIRHFQVM